MYDVGKRETFEKMGRWVDSTKQSAQGAVLLLVGNKSDLMRERAVSFEDGKMLADQLGVLFVETSAKTGSNVAETFQVLVERMLAEKHASPAPQNQPINSASRSLFSCAPACTVQTAPIMAAFNPSDLYRSRSDYCFKITLSGANGAGKTSLLDRFALNEFRSGYHCSIGIEFV